jgi:hypothetical protein
MSGGSARRTRAVINVLLVLIALGIVAAVLLFFHAREEEKAANRVPARTTEEPITYLSTKGPVHSIEERLSARAGFPVTARCPERVSDEVGTTFRCSVRRADGTRLATARVTIDGPRGRFTWTSTPAPRPTPTPTP